MRFFAGGDQSVRGYDYQELGPLDEEDNVIGGEALVVGSVELDRLFFDFGRFGQWGAAVFYDVGGAAHDLGKSLESGVGAGLRWLSPIGLVRVDAAVALDRPGSPIRSTSTLGPTSDDPCTRRVVIGVVLGVLASLGLAAGAAGWLFATPSGARFVLERAGELMPGRLGSTSRRTDPRPAAPRARGVRARGHAPRDQGAVAALASARAGAPAARRRGAGGERRAAADRAHGEGRDSLELPQIDLPVNLAVRQATSAGRRSRSAATSRSASAPPPSRPCRAATLSSSSASISTRPTSELEVSGSLTPLGAYPVDLDLTWALALPDGTRFRGAGTLDGTLEDLTVRQRLTEPFAAVVEARLLDPLDDLRFEGGAEVTGVPLATIDPSWPAMQVSADVAASGSLDDLESKGQVRIVSADYGTVNADVAIEGGAKSWRIERLLLRSDRSRATVTATGSVVLDDPPRFDLEAGWTDLRWPLDAAAAQAMLLAPSGSLRASGTTASYRIEGGLRAALPAVTLAATAGAASIDAQVAVAGDAAGARIERFDGRTLGGASPAKARCRGAPGRLATGDSGGEDLRPGVVDARLDGDLDLAVSTEGTMTEAGPRGSIALRRIAGRVHGQPVRGDGRVELRGEQVRIPDLRLVWGDAAFAAAGVVGDTFDLRFRLDAPDLAKLLPDVAGSLSIDGALDGPRTSPGLEAKLQAVSLAIGTLRAKSIAGTVTAGAGERDPLDVALTVSDLAYGERDFPVARLTATGSRATHTLAATLDGRGPPLERVELRARGGLIERQWRGTIEHAAYAPERDQLWTLQSPATLVAGPAPASGAQQGADLVRLDDFCLGSAGQRACVSASFRSAEDWTIDAKASAFALDRVGKLYREDLDLEGIVDATLEAVGGAGGTVRGRAVVHSKEGSFVVPGDTEIAGRRGYRDAGMRLVAGPDGTRADAEVELIDVGTVNGFVELPRWNTLGMPPREQPLRGRLVARAPARSSRSCSSPTPSRARAADSTSISTSPAPWVSRASKAPAISPTPARSWCRSASRSATSARCQAERPGELMIEGVAAIG